MRARENPFSVERVQMIRYRPLTDAFDDILARLAAMNYRAALVGPEGAGKTTLLEDLQQALERQGERTRLVFVNDTSPLDRQMLTQLRADEIVLLDGADALGPVQWFLLKRRALKHAAGLVITTHRAGRLPTLIHCATTPTLLGDIVGDLMPGTKTVDPTAFDELLQRHQGNIRNCLRDLYDRCAAD